nr:MAG TPA: PROTEIN/RNA Complex translation initiation, 48S, small [Caudoviricetes sp.]
MTENEAIEAIQFDLKIGGEIHSQVLCDAVNVAIQALETVKKLSDRNMTTEVLENYMQFEDECVKKGFTFKSVIEAREKQIAKKPIMKRYFKDLEEEYLCCPTCGQILTDRIPADNKTFYFHCMNCGQKFDWSDGE